MKNLILLTLVLTFGYTPALLSNNNTIESSFDIRKKRLCKTWYVTKAFETRENKPKRDRTNKAMGSSFTFNKDNSFVLVDNARRSSKPAEGIWKETGKNSISVNMEDIELSFEIKKLTKDSLYLVGTYERRGDRKMHIAFSSSYVKPYERSSSEVQEIREYEDMDISEDLEVERPEMEIVEEEIMEETVELAQKMPVEKRGPKYDMNNLPKTWILTKYYTGGKNKTNETIGTSFVLNDDNTFELIEFHKKDKLPEFGRWEIKNDKLEITVGVKTTTYEINFLSTINLIIKDLESGMYSTYTFKAQQ